MKICQINVVYAKGSTGKIVRDLHIGLLEAGYDSMVIYPVKDKFENDKNIFTVSNKWMSRITALYRRISGRQFDGAYIQTRRIINILKKEKPDIVHLHCINGNNINIYKLLRFLANNKINTLLTIHAEFMYTGGCEHSFECEKWKTYCHKCDNKSRGTFIDGSSHTFKSLQKCYQLFDKDKFKFIAVSPWLENRAKNSPMLSRFLSGTVYNGVDTSVYTYTESDYIRNELGILPDEKIIFHITANFDPTSDNLKGGKFVVKLAEMLKKENVRIVIAANNIVKSKIPSNCIILGKILDSKKLAEIYSVSDITLITSKRETFSMPTAESLCCGTPVVGFLAGGPESIALKQYSNFVEYGNIDCLYSTIIKMLNSTYDKHEISKQAKQTYARQEMLNRYLKHYTAKE